MSKNMYIMQNLNKIIDILYEIKEDEEACNEGSLTDREMDKIMILFNLCFKKLLED